MTKDPRARAFVSRLLKEPLLHFLLIGAALFGIFELLGSESRKTPAARSPKQLVVTPERIRHLAATFNETWQRPPTSAELEALVDDFVENEVFYREAVALGLAEEDPVVRRRLRQRMESLADDASDRPSPTDETLAAYLANNKDRFQRKPSYTFRQIHYGPPRPGPEPEATLETDLARLRAGKPVPPKKSVLPKSFADASALVVNGTFGAGFSKQLDALPLGEWSGPLRSDLGFHLVRLEARSPAQLPPLDEIRFLVLREWANEKRAETRANLAQSLLQQYEIVIQWPANHRPENQIPATGNRQPNTSPP